MNKILAQKGKFEKLALRKINLLRFSRVAVATLATFQIRACLAAVKLICFSDVSRSRFRFNSKYSSNANLIPKKRTQVHFTCFLNTIKSPLQLSSIIKITKQSKIKPMLAYAKTKNTFKNQHKKSLYITHTLLL